MVTKKSARWGSAIVGALGVVVAIATPTKAQSVASVQNIQTAPLEIVAPYNTFSSAQPAVVSLQINEPATLSVSSPLPQGFSDPSGTNYSSTLYYNGREAAAETPLNINTLGDIEVEIDMQVVRPQAYSVDTYTYDVLLTIVAQ